MVEMATMTFDEQVATLLQRGLADDEAAFRREMESARPAEPVSRSVLTVSREVVPVAVAAAAVERRGRPVVLGHLTPDDLDTFIPIDAVKLPDATAYLAVEVDLGADSRDVPPKDALSDILEDGRSPLTLDEGIALVLQQPEAIARNWGSRWLGPGVATSGSPRSGSARADRSSAGAGTATLTRGSAPPRARGAPRTRRRPVPPGRIRLREPARASWPTPLPSAG